MRKARKGPRSASPAPSSRPTLLLESSTERASPSPPKWEGILALLPTPRGPEGLASPSYSLLICKTRVTSFPNGGWGLMGGCRSSVCILQGSSRHWVSGGVFSTTVIATFHSKLFTATRPGHILSPTWGILLFQTSQIFKTKENPVSLLSDTSIPNSNFIQKGILYPLFKKKNFYPLISR